SVQVLIIDEVGETYKAVRIARSSASVDENELRRSVALKQWTDINCKVEVLVKLAEYE
ncbi:3475_t:CDS:2, partial [Funneliformis geosporum]